MEAGKGLHPSKVRRYLGRKLGKNVPKTVIFLPFS
jgi:hypothetical protein